MRRRLHWNVLEAPDAAGAVELLDERRRALVEPVFARFAALDLVALPHQVIHNDANEHNVLVGEDGAVTGLIDFGDLVWSAAGGRAGRRAGLRDAGPRRTRCAPSRRWCAATTRWRR